MSISVKTQELFPCTLSVPDKNRRWYQCYLSNPYIAGGVSITCDEIDETYTYKQNSTLFSYNNNLPKSVTKLLLNYDITKKIEVNDKSSRS